MLAAATLAGCSAKESGEPAGAAASAGVGGSATSASSGSGGSGGGVDLDAGRGGGGPVDDCPESAKLVYLIGLDGQLLRFDPNTLDVTTVGPLDCPMTNDAG